MTLMERGAVDGSAHAAVMYPPATKLETVIQVNQSASAM
jgi:hypothetical protein